MKTTMIGLACAGLFAAGIAAAQAPPFAAAKCDAGSSATVARIRLPQTVLANGTALPAGTYQVRLTNSQPAPAAGQSPNAECWVEFTRGGAVAGREVATVIAAADIAQVAKGPGPKPDAFRVDTLKGGDYLRVWINSHGTHYLLNMPVAR